MKQTIIIFTAVCMLLSCNKPERGAPDVETLSKKLFDTFRNNEGQKSSFLLPDKGTFRKIEAEKGVTHSDLDETYNNFVEVANEHFNTVYSSIPTWENCKYNRSAFTSSKVDKLPLTRVSTKFSNGNEPCKFEFTTVKFNNRWYYYGDVIWIPKSEADKLK